MQTGASDLASNFTTLTRKEGDVLTLNCTVTGQPMPTAQWAFASTDNDKVDDSALDYTIVVNGTHSSAHLHIDRVQAVDQGAYVCQASYLDLTQTLFYAHLVVSSGEKLEIDYCVPSNSPFM